MSERSPEDLGWLAELVQHTPLLPDPALRRHWLTLLPWLPTAARYELAATLRDIEQHFDTA